VAKGDYAVPEEVRALRPAGVDCIVKRISGHYYVYERRRVDDPARPGRTKWVSGGIIGKIEGGRYVPNAPRGDGATDAPCTKPTSRKPNILTSITTAMTMAMFFLTCFSICSFLMATSPEIHMFSDTYCRWVARIFVWFSFSSCWPSGSS
jgi:hypothetical protein